jgi:hypothetical protein
MPSPAELGLQLLAAAREIDPEWEDPPDGPARSYVVEGEEDGALLAVGAQVVGVGVRYWCKVDDPMFGQSTTWKNVEQHGRSVWKIWGEGGWRFIAEAPPFAPELN